MIEGRKNEEGRQEILVEPAQYDSPDRSPCRDDGWLYHHETE